MNWYKKTIIAQRKKVQLTPEDINKIKELVLRGETFSNIAKQFNVSYFYIQKLNQRYKWRPIKKRNRIQLTSEDINKIKELVLRGEDFVDISKWFNIPINYIQKLNYIHKWRAEIGDIEKNEEIVDTIDDLHERNYNLVDIARILNLPYEELKRFFMKTNRPIDTPEEQNLKMNN